jgi:protein TonB
MSDIAFDQGGLFPSPLTEWYRERPFKLALAGSLLVHALLLALVPGFRAVPHDVPKVMDVEILREETPVARVPVQKQAPPPVKREEVVPPPVVETPTPVVEPPKPVEQVKPEPRKVEPQPVPKVVEPEPVRLPEPVARQPEPVAPPPPKTEVLQTAPRPEQKPEQFSMPRPEPRPQPSQVEPRPEIRPEPPVARVTPTQPVPVVPPRAEPVTPPQAVSPPPAAAPPPQAAVQPPPPPAAPAQPAAAVESTAVASYQQNLSTLVNRKKIYPQRAVRQRLEGTAYVSLTLAPDGNVANISLQKSSGHDILDQAALEMVRKASPLPRAPEILRGKERVISIPIRFELQNS